MNYLVHHGILKQKWGVRRFQNPDGTLTEAGRQRYRKNGDYESEHDRRAKRAVRIAAVAGALGAAGAIGAAAGAAHSSHKNQNKPSQLEEKKETVRNAKDMTDEELKKFNARATLENNYNKNIGANNKSDPTADGIKNLQTGVNNIQTSVNTLQKTTSDIRKTDAYVNAKETAKGMSDDELKQVINRMNLEKQYANLSADDVDSGRQRVDEILAYTSIAIGLIGGGLTIAKTIHDFRKK